MKSLTTQVGYAEKAYNHLREHILSGKLARFSYCELEFSEALKMSRTPVREAIHRLIAEGVLLRLRGRGTFVRSLSRDEVCSVYEYAEGLEGMVAFLAAQKYDSAFERRILEPIEAMEAEIEKSTGLGTNEIAWAAADRSFHDSLYDICPNRIIVEGLGEFMPSSVLFVLAYRDSCWIDGNQLRIIEIRQPQFCPPETPMVHGLPCNVTGKGFARTS